MKHAYIAFHQLASVVRLSCLYKSTVTNLPLFFLFCSTTISCAEKKFAHFQKAYINFGIFNPYSCSLEGWMHQIFSILTHCSAFKSCCLLQWDTGKALLLNFSSFFFSFLLKSTTTSIYFLTPTQYLPTGSFWLLLVRWDSSVHLCLTHTMFLFQDSFYVPSAWTGVHFVWGKVNRTIFRMMWFSVLKQHYSGLYPPPFRLWKDASLKELNMEIKADLY